ncbi:Asp23/Gls24 family envelope stress response protein [Microlunatus capsulatus]|uniref:Alkaline shock family protein YloU n=1 Tax=Microlunatus capsulatus TaxID=99117 RepID=A0ABS4ZA61_9ACTN|nr:Asp23/Gls24 family envelope stress response protein [Microlunatus capsulatus]MBP2417635.1 putative alkaline shock family protein YloU [Microlunatus capsulatus]
MSQSVVPATGEERRQAEAQAAKNAEKAEPKQLDALHTEHGDTTIADGVVAKIAGIAAREVSGVYAMGNAARRAIGNLAQRIPGSTQPSVSGGVSVEKGERETAIDISVVVEYGVSIVTVSDQIRENVISAVEYGTGLDVVSVDVNVTDVHLPEDDADDAGSSSDPLR